nr:methyltransferase domain-containing protein [Romboutsia sp. 1001713B170131_170501_G6]
MTDNSDDITCFLDTIKYNVGNHILLVGKIGDLGKRLRRLGVYVTILENSPYEDVCYSLIHNGNCNVIKGTLELLPFEDRHFDKVIILDHFNNTGNFKQASKEINRVLKIDGELILEDLNLKNIKVKLKNLKHKLCGENIKYHYPNDVAKLFSTLDFEGNVKEVENERYIYIGKRK